MGEEAGNVAVFGQLVIDRAAWEVRLQGQVVHLTKTEFVLLALLSAQPRRVFSPVDMAQAVWGATWPRVEANVHVHMSNLRRKLGETPLKPRYLHTVRGVGYRFEPNPPEAPEHATPPVSGDSLPGDTPRTDGPPPQGGG